MSIKSSVYPPTQSGAVQSGNISKNVWVDCRGGGRQGQSWRAIESKIDHFSCISKRFVFKHWDSELVYTVS